MLGLRRILREKGHDVQLFSSTAGHPEQADFTCRGTTSSFRTILQSANPWAKKRLKSVLRSFQPDVVHVTLFLTQLSPLILPLLKDIPTVHYAVWYRLICPLGTKMLPDGSICKVPAGFVCYRNGCLPLRDWIPLTTQAAMLKRWSSAFRIVVANSEAVRHRLQTDGIPVSQVIHPGVPDFGQRSPAGESPVIGFAGRLVREKGVDTLLHAFSRILGDMPNARVCIVGDGPDLSRLRKMAVELGVAKSVDFAGHLPRDQMESLLRQSRVQAVPSLWPEPFGMTAVEAMMRGVSVVASDTAGLGEIIQDNVTGYLVPSGDPARLSDAILRLLKNSSLAETMGARARQKALERFSETVFVDQFLKLYQSIIR